MGEIYKITQKFSKKCYIGQTILISSEGRIMGYKKRWKRHIQNAERNYKGGCPVLENAIRKYGEYNFDVECLKKCKIDELNYYEKVYMIEFNSLVPNGYNNIRKKIRTSNRI